MSLDQYVLRQGWIYTIYLRLRWIYTIDDYGTISYFYPSDWILEPGHSDHKLGDSPNVTPTVPVPTGREIPV